MKALDWVKQGVVYSCNKEGVLSVGSCMS
jgi:hypothetical protein